MNHFAITGQSVTDIPLFASPVVQWHFFSSQVSDTIQQKAKESTFPARTSLCSLVPGDPHSLLLPRLCFLFYHIFSTSYFSSTLLHFLLRIISPSSVGVLSPGSYTSELQLDAHLNSESTPVCLFYSQYLRFVLCFMPLTESLLLGNPTKDAYACTQQSPCL